MNLLITPHRYFDAARSYGRAEEFLSGWLAARGLARDDLLVGSKWGYYYTADWRVGGGLPTADHVHVHVHACAHTHAHARTHIHTLTRAHTH